MTCDMTWQHVTWHDMICDMTWQLMWHDMMTWHDNWCDMTCCLCNVSLYHITITILPYFHYQLPLPHYHYPNSITTLQWHVTWHDNMFHLVQGLVIKTYFWWGWITLFKTYKKNLWTLSKWKPCFPCFFLKYNITDSS